MGTQLQGDANLDLIRVILSDGTVLEGDAVPAMSLAKQFDLFNPDARTDKAKLAEQVHNLFLDVVKRRLTVDDVAVLMQRVIQGKKIDGLQAALFVLVGMRVHAIDQRRRGGTKPKLAPATNQALEELVQVKPALSVTEVLRRLALEGHEVSRPTVKKRMQQPTK